MADVNPDMLLDTAERNRDTAQKVRSSLRQKPLDDALQAVYSQYPRLSGYDFQAAYGDKGKGPGRLEFYPPDEGRNPRPGVPFIEVYDRGLEGPALTRALFGDALHYLPMVDENFAQMRDSFIGTLTPEQLAVDRNAYERAKREFGETRSFEDWFDISRKDAYLRGYLAPDERDEWRDVYTPDQRKILEEMRSYLRQSNG